MFRGVLLSDTNVPTIEAHRELSLHDKSRRVGNTKRVIGISRIAYE